MRIEFRQLRSFLAVAEEKSFRRAAERIFLTQPALSQHISALEQALEVKLFEREARGVRLTTAGEAFREGASRTLRALDEASVAARSAAGLADRKLTLGYTEYLNLPFVAPAIRALLAEFPSLRFERLEVASPRQLEALPSHGIDLGIGYLRGEPPESLDFTPLVSGRWLIVLPQEHPLAQQDSVSVAALRGERIVLFARLINPQLHDAVLGLMRAHGLEPNLIETTQTSAGPRLVREGLGLFWVMSYVLGPVPEGLVARPLALPADTQITIGALSRKGEASLPAQRLLTLLKEQARAAYRDRG